MAENRQSGSSVTRRNYRKKRGLSKGGRIVVWTVIFLLCFFVPFFIIYFGSGNNNSDTSLEMVESELTPEARIYQLEQENEQLRKQISDLEKMLEDAGTPVDTFLDSSQNTSGSSTTGNNDSSGWEEISTQKRPKEEPKEEENTEGSTEGNTEDSTEEKPNANTTTEPKPEVKPETKPEPKPEPKPEVKPEVKPESETKPTDSQNNTGSAPENTEPAKPETTTPSAPPAVSEPEPDSSMFGDEGI